MNHGITRGGLASAICLTILLLVPTGMWAYGVPVPWAKAPPPPPPLAVVQSLSELATARIHISDSIEGENAHYRGKWALHGEVMLGVDLSKAAYRRVDSVNRKAVLELPQPHLLSSKVDHDRSEELYVKAISFMALTSDPKVLRDEVWKQADRKIERLGQEPGYMERAKVQAERVLQELFNGVGWAVSVEWQG